MARLFLLSSVAQIRSAPILGGLVVALAAVGVATVRMGQRDQEDLLADFAAERLNQLTEVSGEVQESIHDVADALVFAGDLLEDAHSEAETRRILEGLAAFGRAPRAAASVHHDNRTQLALRQGWGAKEGNKGLVEELRRSVVRTAATGGPGLTISTPIGTPAGGWYRVLAESVSRRRRDGGARAVGLLVDMRPFLARLRALSTPAGTRLIVLGPHGVLTPATSEALRGVLALGPDAPQLGPSLAVLYRGMERGDSGTVTISAEEAHGLGFSDDDVVLAAFAPMVVEGGPHWSVATLSSTSRLRAHEARVWRRLGLTAAGVAAALVLCFGYVLVISRRAAVLRERARNATELASIFDTVPVGIIAVDNSDAVVTMNRFVRERLADEPKEPPALSSVLASADALASERVGSLISRARGQRTPCSLVGEQLSLLDGITDCSVHVLPLGGEQETDQVLVVIEDLTEAKRLESHLLRAEKLATVGTLAAGIAHEIGTPLGVVRGRAEYILGKLGENHAQAAGLRVIVEQIDRIARTISALLDFSRIKPTALAQVDIGPTLRKVAELLQYEAQRRRVTLQISDTHGMPPLCADSDALEQVLINLLMNAYDAVCAGGGKVLVAAQVEATAAEQSGRARIDIIDDGVGIPEENRHRVFDPFFTTKKRGQGTGLGLAIVAQIARAHGAQIALASRVGGGTRATLLWPTVAEHEGTQR